MAEVALPRQVWPPGGLEHPVFDSEGVGDHYLVVLTFAGDQPESALRGVEAALEAWSQAAGRLDPQDAVHAEEPFLTRTALRVRAHNLEHPRAALQRLLGRLQAAAPIAEVFLARLESAGGDQFAPARDPRSGRERAHFHTAAEFMACLLDPLVEPPASEYVSQLGGAIRLKDGDLAIEERGMPLWFPGIRLGYGTARGSFTAVDERTRAVGTGLQQALARAFPGVGGAVPACFDHRGKMGVVDRLTYAGRVGYGFGVPSDSLVYRYAQRLYRYREAELFTGVVEAVGALGLAPLIGWQRFGAPLVGELRSVQTHVVQLWEK